MKSESEVREDKLQRSAGNSDGNDTVPISVWHNRSTLSDECTLQLVLCRVLSAKMVGATSSEGFPTVTPFE